MAAPLAEHLPGLARSVLHLTVCAVGDEDEALVLVLGEARGPTPRRSAASPCRPGIPLRTCRPSGKPGCGCSAGRTHRQARRSKRARNAPDWRTASTARRSASRAVACRRSVGCRRHPNRAVGAGWSRTRYAPIAVAVGDEDFVGTIVGEHVRRTIEPRSVTRTWALAAVVLADLVDEFSVRREVQDLVAIVVAADPDGAVRADVQAVLVRHPLVASPGPPQWRSRFPSMSNSMTAAPPCSIWSRAGSFCAPFSSSTSDAGRRPSDRPDGTREKLESGRQRGFRHRVGRTTWRGKRSAFRTIGGRGTFGSTLGSGLELERFFALNSVPQRPGALCRRLHPPFTIILARSTKGGEAVLKSLEYQYPPRAHAAGSSPSQRPSRHRYSSSPHRAPGKT